MPINKTLLLSHRYTQDSNAIFSAAVSLGYDVKRLHSFHHSIDSDISDPIFYGETILADSIMDKLKFYLLEPTIDWLIKVPQKYLLRNVELVKIKDLDKIVFPKFIKCTDEKFFQARVYNSLDDFNINQNLEKDFPILISDPVKFIQEFRFFILEREIATFSPYIKNGELSKNSFGEWDAEQADIDHAVSKMKEILNDSSVEFPASAVVDVGFIENKDWAIVEVNPAWASGICGADPVKVLSVLERCCIKFENVSKNDILWTRNILKQ